MMNFTGHNLAFNAGQVAGLVWGVLIFLPFLFLALWIFKGLFKVLKTILIILLTPIAIILSLPLSLFKSMRGKGNDDE